MLYGQGDCACVVRAVTAIITHTHRQHEEVDLQSPELRGLAPQYLRECLDHTRIDMGHISLCI